MLIAEDLLLLLTDDVTGKPLVDSQRLTYAAAGAVLVELVLADRVAVTDGGRWGSGPRVAVVNPTPLGDQVLDAALSRVVAGRQPVGASSLLGGLGKGLLDALRTRLAARGILRRVDGKVLGLFPTSAWPAVDSQHEAGLRWALRDVLLTGRTPTAREACLVALLHATDQVPKQFAADGVTRGQLRDRAKEISAGNVGGEAVKRAIEAMNAAVIAGVTAAGVAAAGSS